MPNVNYRGKPLQDPNVPPESGVTSIPLGAPWPPLSREQVVKLHQALVAFRGGMEASKGIRSHEDQQDMILGAAVELDGLLVEMGIGSPPPTWTWTHEEVAKVAEEVQTFTDSQSDMDCILAMSAPGRTPVLATMVGELKSPADDPRRQEGQWEEPPKRNCYTCRWHPKDGCEVKPFTKEVIHWLRDTDRDQPHGLMLPTADGCPGWEPKS